MADNVIGLNQHFDAPASWHTWQVTMPASGGGETVDIPLDTLPDDLYIVDAFFTLTVAGLGTAATMALDVEIGTTSVWTTSSLKTTVGRDQATAGEINAMNAEILASSGGVLNCEVTYATGTVTTPPTFLLHLLCGRVSY